MKNSNTKRSFNIINSLAVNESQLKYPVDQKAFLFLYHRRGVFQGVLQHRVAKDNGYRTIFRRFTPITTATFVSPSGVSFIAVAKWWSNTQTELYFFRDLIYLPAIPFIKSRAIFVARRNVQLVNNSAMRFFIISISGEPERLCHNTVLMMLHTLKPIPRLSPCGRSYGFGKGDAAMAMRFTG